MQPFLANYLSSRINEVFLSGHWIANTNYRELLASITWKQATQKVGDLNTIGALIFHVNYYLSGLIKVFEGGELEIHDKYSFNLPPVESENDWKQLLDEFLENSKKFAYHVEQMNDDILDRAFVNEKYGTYLRNIEGVIEHSYYHLGQLSLLRKLTAGT